MTRPVPDRLVPLWREQHSVGGTVLTCLAFFLAVAAGFDAHLGDVSAMNFLSFSLAALALHLLWPTTPFAGR